MVFILVMSCSQSKEKHDTDISADSVLTEQEFEAVLFDMYLAESYIRQQERDGKNNKYFSKHYYTLMFEKHNTDSIAMRRSYLWYAARPELLKEINQRVLDSLIIMETNLPVEQE